MKMETIQAKYDEWAIPALFLAIPFSVLSMGLIWKSHQLFFICMGLAVLASVIKNVWVKSFLLYSFVWQIFVFMANLTTPMFNVGAAFSLNLSIMAGAMVYKFISESTLKTEHFYTVIRIAVLIQVAICFLQHFGADPVPWVISHFLPTKTTVEGQMVGTLGNRNFIAAFIALSIPLFLSWQTKPLLKWAATIVVFAALFLAPGPGILAALVGCAIYLKGGRCGIVMGITAALLYVFYYVGIKGHHASELMDFPALARDFFSSGMVNIPADQNDAGRLGMALMAYAKLSASWIKLVFGCGPGVNWGRNYPMHNEYMTMWFYFGLVGLGLFTGYIVTTFKFIAKYSSTAIRKIKGKSLVVTEPRTLLACFAILVVDMAGNYTLEIATTAFMALIICGLVERERLRQ